ncbi:nucleotidyl transferase AbiEii/AbiGii toxin family protein [Candidatus Wolfebacteria bacterium]|nr:nucleotidyl transferase AbiEii/AbiGii toxin family protein [Candidatus Wolfebacteria bacterium]
MPNQPPGAFPNMLFYETLNQKQKDVLERLKPLMPRFWLAGGTNLALRLGHRKSVDFDFFTGADFDTEKLFQEIKKLVGNSSLQRIQEEKNTLTVIADTVKISFFTYPYPLISPTETVDGIVLASLDDIAGMKAATIVSRATLKDYVDLYVLLQRVPLDRLLRIVRQKTPEIDPNLVLKSIVYLDDIPEETIDYVNTNPLSFDELKVFFRNLVKPR